MVTQINFHMDDDQYEKAAEVKEDLGLTWPEFIDRAADALKGGTQSEN